MSEFAQGMARARRRSEGNMASFANPTSSHQGEKKETTMDLGVQLGQFYLLSIGMDIWTKDAKDMSDLFKNTLNKIWTIFLSTFSLLKQNF